MRKRILSTALALCMLLSLLPSVSIPALAVGSQASASLSVVNVSGEVGQTINLTATLTSSENPVSGQSVAFSIDSTGVGSATTNASGVASLSYTITAGVGSHTIGASFSETADYYSSIGSGTLTVTPTLHVGNTLVYGSLTGGLSAGTTYYWKAAESGDDAYAQTGSADDYLFSVSYDEDNDIFTLTLNGVSITTTDSSHGVYSNSSLNIVLVDGTLNSVSSSGDAITVSGDTSGSVGDDSSNDISISGSGSLTVTSGSASGIYSPNGNISIAGGNVAVSGNTGIFTYVGGLTVSGGTVTAAGRQNGIWSRGGVTISGGLLKVTATNTHGQSIYTPGSVSVTANPYSYRYSQTPCRGTAYSSCPVRLRLCLS